MSQLAELRTRATELGIVFDQRWGENKLKAAIAAVDTYDGPLAEQPEPEAQALVADEQPEEQQEQSDTGDEVAEQPEPIEAPAEPTQVEAVAELPIDTDSITVRNISKNPMTIDFQFKAKPNFTITIKSAQLTDKLRAKINYGVKLGLLELV